MSGLERKTYVLTWLGFGVAVLSLALAYYAIRVSWKIAEVSGSLDKPGIVVGIGDYPLAAGKRNYVVLGAPLPSSDAPAVGAIPFTFHSSGRKSLDSISISFQYHKLFNRALLEEVTLSSPSGAFGANDLRKSTSQSGDMFFVTYAMPSLNPGVGVEIGEPMLLGETRIQSEIPVTFKDGVKATVSLAAAYSKEFGLAVTSRDTEVLGYPVSVAMQSAASMDELARSPHLIGHVERQQKELRAKLGALSYLMALLTTSPESDVYLIYDPLKRVTSGEVTVFSPAKDQQVTKAVFPLLSWRLLF
ncbi:hypothetical protein [Lysobacter silvisoli]|uniref:Uncharacterized protein n=1 Tax=Lysobacter silvisoli TaxID=2293254 RepID=A0A371K4G1_9GAMM|nr:hypothetical protein [Lysobacter silvisoli]RDZ28760.1 hypothetical protein DX914_06475 [Lysobacter silvisoli]